MIASKEQRDIIVELAGHVLLRERSVDLWQIERDDANRLRLALEYELKNGSPPDGDPPPPRVDRRIHAV